MVLCFYLSDMPYCADCGEQLAGESAFCPRCGVLVRASGSPNLATFGTRFVAWFIDLVIVGSLVFLLDLPGIVVYQGIPFVTVGSREVIMLLYWTIMDGYAGQSIGKMAMRIKVAKTNGSQPSYWEAAIESVGKAFLLPVDVLVGWLIPAAQAKQQRLFNMLSETIVTNVR
jgi:uncharacterized RDD family membrane protein YckC